MIFQIRKTQSAIQVGVGKVWLVLSLPRLRGGGMSRWRVPGSDWQRTKFWDKSYCGETVVLRFWRLFIFLM